MSGLFALISARTRSWPLFARLAAATWLTAGLACFIIGPSLDDVSSGPAAAIVLPFVLFVLAVIVANLARFVGGIAGARTDGR
ncbi:hypothetical protein [Aurantiacibacter spongiae]|uniref:Uncharacterized protein n=1 Tax=Aurantiacibacter spongiae TaxID=2488860 RepID=A0A3N5CSR9_9SPHN|nr:hypothetical protein [Aurantiacibacter spongiae]RPF70380.1 hypothetical protein EG799_01090 [Aurantiacibacter spongiae]